LLQPRQILSTRLVGQARTRRRWR